MTVSKEAREDCARMAIAVDPDQGWEASDFGNDASPPLRAFAQFRQEVSDAVKAWDTAEMENVAERMEALCVFILPDGELDSIPFPTGVGDSRISMDWLRTELDRHGLQITPKSIPHVDRQPGDRTT